MTKKRDPLPPVERLTLELDALERLMKRRPEIERGYEMALGLGGDPRAGSDGPAVMAGFSDYVADAVVGDVNTKKPPPSEFYRDFAKALFSKVEQARMNIGNILVAVNRGRMGEAFTQPTHTDRAAVITQDELDEAIVKRRRGEEMTG